MTDNEQVGLVTDYINVPNAAKRIGRSKSLIEYYIRSGNLTAHWFTGIGERLILRSDLDELLKIPRYGGRRDSNDG